jgi:hypothetical protein
MARPASRFTAIALLATMATACAHQPLQKVTDAGAPRSLPAEGPVDVRWRDPETFAEIRNSHNPTESRRGDWVTELAGHVRKRAAGRLAPGERLDVEFIDIDLAGDFEPWRGISMDDTRFMREIYPPRITLSFTRTDAAGAVVAQGERRLVDAMYLGGPGGSDNDMLRYEKRMLDQWLARDIPR